MSALKRTAWRIAKKGLPKFFNTLVILAFLFQPFASLSLYGGVSFRTSVAIAAEDEEMAEAVSDESEKDEEEKEDPVKEKDEEEKEEINEEAEIKEEELVAQEETVMPETTDEKTVSDEEATGGTGDETVTENPSEETPVTEETLILETENEGSTEPIVTDSEIAEQAEETTESEEATEPVATWQEEGNKATTSEVVKLGETYVAPQNSEVSVTFTKLPENSGTLSIEEVALSDAEMEKLDSVWRNAYDITSSMENGTFEYELTLPIPKDAENIEIRFAEDISDLANVEIVEADDLKKESDSVTATLDHFTLFAVSTHPTFSSSFVGSPKYVRQGNSSSDIVAQISVPSSAIAVQFNVEGVDVALNETVSDGNDTNETKDDDIYKVSGAGSGSQWWRLQKALAGGEYEITAEFTEDGTTWYLVNGSGITFSIDTPTVEYIVPGGPGEYFRSSDNPLRVKAEDQYDQFKQVEYEIYNVSNALLGTYTVLRSECDLRAAGNYVLCDANESNTWSLLGDGEYYAKATTYTLANNRFDDLRSENFIIDNTKPVVSNVVITNAAPVFTTPIDVNADVSDNNALDTATFFITAPRISDNACDGNGAHLVENVEFLNGVASDTVSTSLDTSGLNGTYCVNVSAKDMGASNSVIAGKIKVVIDNAAPSVPTNGTPHNTTIPTNDFDFDWDDSTDSSAVTYVFQSSQNPAESGGVLTTGLWTSGTLPTSMIHSSGAGDGTWYWQVRAMDTAGNTSAWSPIWNVTLDTAAPTVPVLASPADNSYVTTSDFTFSWNASTDVSPITYLWEASLSPAVNGSGNFVSPIASHTLSATSVYSPGTPDNAYYWHVRASDNQGHTSAWSPTWKVTVDTINPLIDITNPIEGQYVNGFLPLQGTITDVNFSYYYYYLTGTAVTPSVTVYSQKTNESLGQIDTTTLAEGPYTLHFVARDTAGNVNTKDINIVVDNTPPTVTLNFPAIGPGATSFEVIFSENVNAAEASDPKNYFLNNWPGAGGSGNLDGDATVTYNPADSTATVLLTNPGWYVSAEQEWGVENVHDLAGNLQEPMSYDDTSTPMVAPTTTDNTDANWHNTNVTVTLTCDDGPADTGSGCQVTRYTTDGTDPVASSPAGTTVVVTAEGETIIKYSSWDKAGNMETAKTATYPVKIDKTNPNDPTPSSASHSINTWSADRTVDVAWSGASDGSGSGVDGFYTEWNTSSNSLTGAPFKEYEETATSETSPTLGSGQNHYFHIATVDNAGNWTATAHFGPFWIDATRPTVSWVTPANGALLMGTVNLEAIAADVHSGMEKVRFRYQLVGTTGFTLIAAVASPYETIWNTESVADGVYTLRANAQDNVGRNRSADITITIDNTDPTGTVNVNTDPVFDGDLVQEVTVTYNEAMDTAFTPTISLATTTGTWASDGNGAWSGNTVWTESFTVTDANEEVASVTVSSSNGRDLAGNTEGTSVNDSFAVDTKNPVTTVNSLLTNDSTPPLTGTVDDATASVQVTVAGTAYSATNNVDGTWTLADNAITPALADGTYDVSAVATDGAGNTGADSTTNELVVDVTAPQTFLAINPTDPDGDNGWYDTHPVVTLSATDNLSGVDRIEYQLNSTTGTWTVYSSPFTLVDGEWQVFFRSFDVATNESNTGLKVVKVDTQGPDNVRNLEADYSNADDEVEVTWDIASNDTKEVRVYRGGSRDFDMNSSTLVATNDASDDNYRHDDPTPGKTYYYKVVAFDDAGNNSSARVVKIEIPEADENTDATGTDEGTDTIPEGTVLGVETGEGATPSTGTTLTEEGGEGDQTGTEEGSVLGEETINIEDDETRPFWQWMLLVLVLALLGYYGVQYFKAPKPPLAS